MQTRTIRTTNAPAAIGPYSQAVVAGAIVYCSGQIPLRPDGTLAGDDIESQTHQVLLNLGAVLESAGASLGTVLKTTVYMTSLDEFSAMNGVYATYFTERPPARATVEVTRLPRGVRVEIDCVARCVPVAPGL